MTAKTAKKENVVDIATFYKKTITPNRPEELVDVQLPSGVVFKFVKPNLYEHMFRVGKVPQKATSGAVQKWIELGVLKPSEVKPGEIDKINEGIKLRDKILELSRSPRLVVGDAINPGELSTDDLAPQDTAFLFAWVRSGGLLEADHPEGGEVAQEVTTFPPGPGENLVAGTNRKVRRAAAKRTGGTARKVRAK